MPNMKDLSLKVKKLWPMLMLEFLKSRSKVTVKVTHKNFYGTIGKFLS